jgi:hypothetical protein
MNVFTGNRALRKGIRDGPEVVNAEGKNFSAARVFGSREISSPETGNWFAIAPDHDITITRWTLALKTILPGFRFDMFPAERPACPLAEKQPLPERTRSGRLQPWGILRLRGAGERHSFSSIGEGQHCKIRKSPQGGELQMHSSRSSRHFFGPCGSRFGMPPRKWRLVSTLYSTFTEKLDCATSVPRCAVTSTSQCPGPGEADHRNRPSAPGDPRFRGCARFPGHPQQVFNVTSPCRRQSSPMTTK